MKLDVDISIPELWYAEKFVKNEWGTINFIVGSNGTGKSLFAERLKVICSNKLNSRYLSAERLMGLEKKSSGFANSSLNQGYGMGDFSTYKQWGNQYDTASDAIVILKERLDLKIKIESTLSDLFGRHLRLVEENGYLKPKIQKTSFGNEYGMKESESHGLKELIVLLTFLYNDDYKFLIIDEPELHLHPQYQTFFLEEIRKISGDPTVDVNKKCVFLITHSPYFVDVRTIEDLKNCIVFHPTGVPTFINELTEEEEFRVKRLLPKLNTHHKQFFFSSRPVFVEGYTDQQLFTLIQEKRHKLLGASGSSIIDVGGKESLDLFFKLCGQLKINAQFITDLDALFNGNLRQSVSKDERCKTFLQQEGIDTELMNHVGQIEHSIDECIMAIKDAKIDPTFTKLILLKEEITKSAEDKKLRYAFLIGLYFLNDEIKNLIPSKKDKIAFIEGSMLKIIEAFKTCNVYLLRKGELENYLPSYDDNPYSISDDSKNKVFNEERDIILNIETTEKQVVERYSELIKILDEAINSVSVNMDLHIGYEIGEWIHKVQSAFVRGLIKNKENLTENSSIELTKYSKMFELIDFVPDVDGFSCKIKLKISVDPNERMIEFNDKTVPANYKLS